MIHSSINKLYRSIAQLSRNTYSISIYKCANQIQVNHHICLDSLTQLHRQFHHKSIHSTTIQHKPSTMTVNNTVNNKLINNNYNNHAALSLSTYDLVWQYIHERRYKQLSSYSYIWLLIRFTIILNICRILLIDITTVSGKSMEPTFDSSNNIIIYENITQRLHSVCNKLLLYLITMELDINNDKCITDDHIPYKHGDIVIARHPDIHTSRRVIKRIVGLPGDIVTYTVQNASDTKSIHVQPNQLFLLGDNPIESYDSRMYGCIDRHNIIGKVIARIYPLNKINWADHNYNNLYVDVQHATINNTTHHETIEHDFKHQ